MSQCPLCEDFSVPTFPLLLRHIGQVHRNAPDFQVSCGIDACGSTFTNYHTFRRHLRKKHRHVCRDDDIGESSSSPDGPVQEHEPTDHFSFSGELYVCQENLAYSCIYHYADDPLAIQPEEEPSDPSHSHGPSSRARKRGDAAMWVLKLKERRMLTQTATDEILSDVTELCTDIVADTKEEVFTVLRSAGVNPEEIPGLRNIFSESSQHAQPFSNIRTPYLQLSYCRKHLNFVVSRHLQTQDL